MGKELNKTGLDQGDYTSSNLGYEDNTATPGKQQYTHKQGKTSSMNTANTNGHAKSKGQQGKEGKPQSDSVNAGDHLFNADGQVNPDPETYC